MFEITSGSTRGLPDVESFLADLRRSSDHPDPLVRGFFDSDRPVFLSRAPGRLDLMGGIADYSGSLVLQWPLREATLAAVQVDPNPEVRAVSLLDGGSTGPHPPAEERGVERAPSFSIALDALAPGGRPLTYPEARALFRRDPERQWAAYAVGTLLVLMHERGLRLDRGLRLLVRSDVPEGKGVSSSAALEIAVLQAVAAAFDIALEPRDLALLGQVTENQVVGAPCGVMDQMTSACGREGALLALLCQPAELLGHLELPPELEIFGLDSGERHAVSGSDYTGVRVGAFMGARILAEMAGLSVRARPEGGVAIDDTRWGGHLANITPSVFEVYRDRLPESLRGREFLDRYQGSADLVTRVEPDRSYAVRQPTAHPVFEHFRVGTFAELLAPPFTPDRPRLLGELMYQSHASYGACGLGSPGTDLLVDLVRRAGPERGLFGAKITGGGCGGTVAVLARRGASVQAIARAYAAERGQLPRVFSGSSPGAAAFGHLRLQSP